MQTEAFTRTTLVEQAEDLTPLDSEFECLDHKYEAELDGTYALLYELARAAEILVNYVITNTPESRRLERQAILSDLEQVFGDGSSALTNPVQSLDSRYLVRDRGLRPRSEGSFYLETSRNGWQSSFLARPHPLELLIFSLLTAVSQRKLE